MVIVMKESQYVVDEEDGVVQVCVEIESGSLDGVVATVSLNTEDDSALQSGEALTLGNLLHATLCYCYNVVSNSFATVYSEKHCARTTDVTSNIFVFD